MSLDLDKSTWKRVAFGEHVKNHNDYFVADRDGILPYVAGPHIDPGQASISRYGTTSDDDFPPTFKRTFKSGDVLLHTRGIEKIGVVDRDGVTGEKLFVLRTIDNQKLDQRFIPWLLASPGVRKYLNENFTGSVNKFLNLTPIMAMEFDLPLLDEQKRIADLLWAVERQRSSVKQTRACARDLLGRLAHQRLSDMPNVIRLGDITTTRSGPSFAARDMHEHQVPGSVPILGIPNTKPNGTVDLSGVGYVSGVTASVGKIDESSLVLIRTNGNRQRIGNVYIPPAQAMGHVVSAFQFLMQARIPADREYLFWVLSEPYMQAQMSEAASGTVGLGNLAVRWLNDQEIKWSPDGAERHAVVDELRNLASVITDLDSEEDALRAFQSVLLAEIFGDD